MKAGTGFQAKSLVTYFIYYIMSTSTPPLKPTMGTEDKREDGSSPGEEDSFASIFRQLSSVSSLSSENTPQWPQGLLSKLSSDDLENTTEEERDLPPGEQLLKRSNPVVPSVLSDDLSVKSDVTVGACNTSNDQSAFYKPFYVIQYNKDGYGEVLEQPPVAATSIRKRCRSKDLFLERKKKAVNFPDSKLMRKTAEKMLLKDNDDTNKIQKSAGCHAEMFADFMDALTPIMCGAPVIKANMASHWTPWPAASSKPWHSSSSIGMHSQPRGCSPKEAASFHNKSFLSTTMSACRAF